MPRIITPQGYVSALSHTSAVIDDQSIHSKQLSILGDKKSFCFTSFIYEKNKKKYSIFCLTQTQEHINVENWRGPNLQCGGAKNRIPTGMCYCEALLEDNNQEN